MKKRILGINDDRDFCQCCGKTGLRRVVWIENLETGSIRHFGTTCAGKNAPALFEAIQCAVQRADKRSSRNRAKVADDRMNSPYQLELFPA